MSQLSASAESVLAYVRSHAAEGSVAEIGDDIGLSDDSVIAACRELKSHGKIKNFECSSDSVEFVELP